MGRTEKSQGLAPPAIRKDIRAKQAKQMINKVIPALLASNARANRGVHNSELIVDPTSARANAANDGEKEAQHDTAYIKRKGQGRRKAKNERGADNHDEIKREPRRKRKDSIDVDISNLSLEKHTTKIPSNQPKIRIINTDTLTAAHILTHPSKYGKGHEPKPSKKSPNVCILNMASPLRPGGGVLTGATSQEEFLCARTTLLPSLQETFYRLPELGGIWSPDILVFFNSSPLGDAKGELAPSDRYWIDVISAGMLRFPELETQGNETKRLSRKDALVVEQKMRAVLRIALQKGVKKLVLGAWGCGAYGNPIIDIAQAWKNALLHPTTHTAYSATSHAENSCSGISEIVFAISSHTLAAHFARAFDPTIVVESGPSDEADMESHQERDILADELRARIKEVESQLGKVCNGHLKARLSVVLEGLNAQLVERMGEELRSGDEGTGEEEESGEEIEEESEEEEDG